MADEESKKDGSHTVYDKIPSVDEDEDESLITETNTMRREPKIIQVNENSINLSNNNDKNDGNSNNKEDKDEPEEEIQEETVARVKTFRLTNQGMPNLPPHGCDSYLVVALENYNGDKTKSDGDHQPLKFKKGQAIVVQKSENPSTDDALLLGIYSKMKEGWFPKYFVKTIDEGPFKVGLITKRGAKRKNWKLRWFQLNLPKREITYRVYPGDKEELGTINLERVDKTVEVDPKDFGNLEKPISSGLTGKLKKMYLLKIVTKTRDWWLAFKEEGDRDDWGKCITASLTWPKEGYNGTSSASSSSSSSSDNSNNNNNRPLNSV